MDVKSELSNGSQSRGSQSGGETQRAQAVLVRVAGGLLAAGPGWSAGPITSDSADPDTLVIGPALHPGAKRHHAQQQVLPFPAALCFFAISAMNWGQEADRLRIRARGTLNNL